MRVKRERQKHILAYNYYFLTGGFMRKQSIKKTTQKMRVGRGSKFYKYVSGLSGKRSLLQVARKFNVSRTTAYNWYRSFNWRERVRERDKLINIMVNERLEKGN